MIGAGTNVETEGRRTEEDLVLEKMTHTIEKVFYQREEDPWCSYSPKDHRLVPSTIVGVGRPSCWRPSAVLI